jgi:hypothetical protein
MGTMTLAVEVLLRSIGQSSPHGLFVFWATFPAELLKTARSIFAKIAHGSREELIVSTLVVESWPLFFHTLSNLSCCCLWATHKLLYPLLFMLNIRRLPRVTRFYIILSSRCCKYNCTVIILVKPALAIMAAPLDRVNNILDAYQQHDAESIQEAIESTMHQVYSGCEIEVQDQAISTMLEACGEDVDLLIALTRSFTAAQDAGHNRCLHAISSIPEEDRLRRITAVGK